MPATRTDQIDSLGIVSKEEFEQEMLEHMATYAPKLHELYGDTVFRTLIRQGIQQAFSYGFTCRGPLRFYIELMFSFGHRFDSDPQYPFCQQILKERNDSDQMLRAHRLFTLIDCYILEAVGKQNQHVSAALQRLKDDKACYREPFQINRQAPILPVLNYYYPEKAKAIGQQALMELLQRAEQQAEHYNVATQQGTNLLCLLMFSFGHGVIDDPLYPWVKRTLINTNFQQSQQRIDRLSSKTLTYLSAVGDYFLHSDSR